VQSRIALLLQSFGRELGREEAGGLLVPLKLNRAEIAGMVGARMETVIRIMSRWQKAGIVSSHKQGFLVKNPPALEEMITREG
jgi:CRP-like cAMP-binding protein